MSRVYQCDSCGKPEHVPTIAVEYVTEPDDDSDTETDDEDDEFDLDDDWTEERHFCSFACLSQWAFAQSLDNNTQPI